MITPQDLWVDAVEQAHRASTEVAQRQAITALYYALYHTVGERVRVSTSEADSNHARVLHALKEVHGRAAARYNNVRVLRVQAQYNLHRNIGANDLRLAHEGALAVCGMLRLSPAAPSA